MGKHKLVPVEPTLDMIDAGIDATTVDITEKTAAWIYEAMIAAAPAVQGSRLNSTCQAYRTIRITMY